MAKRSAGTALWLPSERRLTRSTVPVAAAQEGAGTRTTPAAQTSTSTDERRRSLMAVLGESGRQQCRHGQAAPPGIPTRPLTSPAPGANTAAGDRDRVQEQGFPRRGAG